MRMRTTSRSVARGGVMALFISAITCLFVWAPTRAEAKSNICGLTC